MSREFVSARKLSLLEFAQSPGTNGGILVSRHTLRKVYQAKLGGTRGW